MDLQENKILLQFILYSCFFYLSMRKKNFFTGKKGYICHKMPVFRKLFCIDPRKTGKGIEKFSVIKYDE